MENDEINTKLGAIVQWQQDHEKHDDGRFGKLEERLDCIPDRVEMEEIVKKTINDTIFSTAKSTKVLIITVATLIGAFAVIGGGLKTLLAWAGFTMLGK